MDGSLPRGVKEVSISHYHKSASQIHIEKKKRKFADSTARAGSKGDTAIKNKKGGPLRRRPDSVFYALFSIVGRRHRKAPCGCTGKKQDTAGQVRALIRS
jgi:hypothetical protein